MIDILKNVMGIAARVHDMQLAGTLSMIVFGVVLVFGIMNCVLGYRILRFWMMIFGFLIGAGIGLFAVNQIGLGEKLYYVVGMVGAGLILAILSFAVFKAGIFIIGAGIGLTLTIYIIHPTTSFSFFICLLAGVGLGMLALRYEREVIIVGTSILGGILSGFATARLANMEEIPFGIVFSIGFALIGMLIQFAINKPKDDRDYSEDEEEKRVKCRASSDDEDEEENVPDYSYDDLDEDLSNADEEEIDEILDEYGVDEDEVIEEYLEDYYGENKKKKRSASPYQKKDRRSK